MQSSQNSPRGDGARTGDTLRFLEDQIEAGLDRVTTHPVFLRSMSILLNANSYRKRWLRQTLSKALTSLELPVRSDQERMLAVLQELRERLEDLESKTETPSSLRPSASNRSPLEPLERIGVRHVGP